MDIACKKADKIKDLREKYTFIYDYMCDYLDDLFKKNNYCKFCNNKCISDTVKNRNNVNGCCNTALQNGICKHLQNGRCTIKSLSCKLFTCRYLKKEGIIFKINSFPILKNNFNFKQKLIIFDNIFYDEEEMIDLLLKHKRFF